MVWEVVAKATLITVTAMVTLFSYLAEAQPRVGVSAFAIQARGFPCSSLIGLRSPQIATLWGYFGKGLGCLRVWARKRSSVLLEVHPAWREESLQVHRKRLHEIRRFAKSLPRRVRLLVSLGLEDVHSVAVADELSARIRRWNAGGVVRSRRGFSFSGRGADFVESHSPSQPCTTSACVFNFDGRDNGGNRGYRAPWTEANLHPSRSRQIICEQHPGSLVFLWDAGLQGLGDGLRVDVSRRSFVLLHPDVLSKLLNTKCP